MDSIVKTVPSTFPATVAVYRFGSWGAVWQNSESDLDLAILLPHEFAVQAHQAVWINLNAEIAQASRTDRVDLINLRKAKIDFQAEVLRTGGGAVLPGRRCADINLDDMLNAGSKLLRHGATGD